MSNPNYLPFSLPCSSFHNPIMAPSRGLSTPSPPQASSPISSSFTAAHERVLSRQRALATTTSTRLAAQRSAHASNLLSRLPYPLTTLGQRSLETWDVIKGREGTRPAFRVGQVDAELLDEELLELLRGQIGEGLRGFGVCDALVSWATESGSWALGDWANDSPDFRRI